MFMFWVFGCEACEILVLQLGIKPASPTLESEVLPLDHQGSPNAVTFIVPVAYHNSRYIAGIKHLLN